MKLSRMINEDENNFEELKSIKNLIFLEVLMNKDTGEILWDYSEPKFNKSLYGTSDINQFKRMLKKRGINAENA